MNRLTSVTIAVLASTLGMACEESKKPAPTAATAVAPTPPPAPAKPKFDKTQLAALQALPKTADTSTPASAELVTLGKQLYFDARLSKNQDLSCNSCHKLDAYGVDGEPTSTGHKKQKGTRNSPTVFNAALHFRQFWDGRAATVEEQATMPIQNPVEMASDEKRVTSVLSSIPEYAEAFKKAFPADKSAISLKNVGTAIGAYERKLLTPAKFDKFIGGDDSAFSDEEKAGAIAFVQSGCTACHMGSMLGGTMYQKAGLVKPWPNQKDQGRFEATKQEADKMMFKVPTLRNVEKTAPYFHDGSVASLDDAVRMMASYELGKELKDDEVKSIVTFLKTLTAAPAADLLAAPTLPKSTAKTPKPDAT